MRESSLDAYSADDLMRFSYEYRNLLKELGERDPETAHSRLDQMHEFGLKAIATGYKFPIALARAIMQITRDHNFTKYCA